jgi:hypothetical protein
VGFIATFLQCLVALNLNRAGDPSPETCIRKTLYEHVILSLTQAISIARIFSKKSTAQSQEIPHLGI